MPDDVVLDNLLTAYGEPIARYTGQGILTLGGGREIERSLVDSNRKLIEIFEAKTKAKLDEIWGEETQGIDHREAQGQ